MGDEPWAWALQEKIRCLFSIKLTCWICAHRRHSQQESGTCCKTSVCWQHGPGDSAYLFSARPPREAICDEDVIYGLTRGPGGVHNLWCIVFATLDCALSLWGRGGGTGHGACFSERAMVIGAITTCWPIILSIVAMLVTAKIAETLVAVGCWILLAHALSLRRCRLFACTLPSVSIHKADKPESHVMFPKASDFLNEDTATLSTIPDLLPAFCSSSDQEFHSAVSSFWGFWPPVSTQVLFPFVLLQRFLLTSQRYSTGWTDLRPSSYSWFTMSESLGQSCMSQMKRTDCHLDLSLAIVIRAIDPILCYLWHCWCVYLYDYSLKQFVSHQIQPCRTLLRSGIVENDISSGRVLSLIKDEHTFDKEENK